MDQGLGQGVSSQGGKMSNSVFVQVELTTSADGLDVGCERRGVKDNTKVDTTLL